MPTIKNISSMTIQAIGMNGVQIDIPTNKEAIVRSYPTSQDLNVTVKLVDEEPYYNPIAATHNTTLSETPDTITLDPRTAYVLITGITSAITVYGQSVDNSPPLLENYTGTPVIPIEVNMLFTKIAVTGTGTAHIVEYIDMPVVIQ